MRFDEARLLSQPIELNWAGWRSDTHRLQEAGWQISANQDVMRMQMQLALRSPCGGAYAITSGMPWEYMEERRLSFGPIPLHARMTFGREVVFQHMGELPRFEAIDALPRLVEHRRTRLEDFAHFAAPLVRTNEFVVPEESVADLMERILKLQQPDRTNRIRESLKNPHGYRLDSLPEQKFHAQILSFAA